MLRPGRSSCFVLLFGVLAPFSACGGETDTESLADQLALKQKLCGADGPFERAPSGERLECELTCWLKTECQDFRSGREAAVRDCVADCPGEPVCEQDGGCDAG